MIRDPQFMTVQEAAKLLRVSGWTVRRWIASGHLKARRIGPKTIRIPAAEVKRLGAVQPTEPVADQPAAEVA